MVTWDPPVATDSADKSLEYVSPSLYSSFLMALRCNQALSVASLSLCRVTLVGQEPGTEFKEGPNIIKYRVYDQARNRAVCKFIVRVEGELFAK